ncbi:uncharacterized protein FIESC28_06222 [Fusarium coffeatum]|uniref:Nephrocystin 3-like N-terminal domain-containing protein n=1 Tax=Fusarium coffeatum TaxID=231269 RepID=A0A366RNW3_9HYPO|nr:uncharacterized protein FIESC28_06222 [Fusarium coffeatum]RBR18156.1 hypothetical protein FIESC28_06222 [Fusarium coffeatum]
MATQVPLPVDSGEPGTNQGIHNVLARDQSVSLAGTYHDVNITIGDVQKSEDHLSNYNFGPSTFFSVATFKEEIKRCRNAVFVSHPDIDREALANAKGKRADGTCEWILQSPHYQSWLAKEFPVLRISGGPGKGKTVISLFLAEDLTTRLRDGTDRLLSFFCRFQDARFNDPLNVLRSLAYQLLEFSYDATLVNQVLKYFESEEKTRDVLSNLEGLWKILETLLAQQELPTVWCIVDGIDECDSSENLAAKFYEYCGRCGNPNGERKFQFVILGRNIDDSGVTPTINLDKSDNESVTTDVGTFITSSLQQLEMIPRFAECRSEITKLLVDKAEGIFLWVSFIIAELSKKRTCLQIMDTVNAFPKGLNATFARMLGGVDPEYRQVSASILKWITFSERPLTLNELADATAESVLRNHDGAGTGVVADVVFILRPLLQVHEGKVLFVHQSAKEYFTSSHRNSEAPLEEYRFTSNECQGPIAQRCLVVLKESDHQTKKQTHDNNYSTISPLFEYAKEYWAYHIRLSATCPIDINRSFFVNMVLKQDSFLQEIFDPLFPSLHQACAFGIVRWLEALYRHNKPHWKENINVRLRPGRYRLPQLPSKRLPRLPLSWAMASGDESTIRFLLNHGAKSRRSMREAFSYAAEIGQPAAVRILLESGVTFHYAFKERMKNQLWCALLPSDFYECDGDRKSTLNLRHKFCLDRLHDWNIHWLYASHTLLIHAASHGHKPTVQLVLDHGADIEAKADWGNENALCAAAFEGRLDVLKLLLDRGANIEAKDDRGRTALSVAASRRHLSLVECLLGNRADIEATDHFGATALMISIWENNTDIVGYLIDHGANIFARDSPNETGLIKAILRGHMELLGELINCGICADDVAQSNRPLALIAVEHTSERLLHFLFENGVDINKKCPFGVTPLISALTLSWDSKGFTIPSFWNGKSSADITGRFPGLFLDTQRSLCNRPSISFENDAMARTLLSQGADISLCGRVCFYESLLDDERIEWDRRRALEEGTGGVVLDAPPVICAARLSLDWAINLLLERGADCNARATELYLPKRKGFYFIPSTIRGRRKYYEEIERFPDIGWDHIPSWPLPKEVCARPAGSALVYASMSGHLTTVRLLLSYGADTSIEDGFGMTALMWAIKKEFLEIKEVLEAHDAGRI